jgi:hypothetical protein
VDNARKMTLKSENGFVTNVVGLNDFHVLLEKQHKVEKRFFDALMVEAENAPVAKQITLGGIYLIQMSHDGRWNRAKILEKDDKGEISKIQLVDLGYVCSAANSMMRECRSYLLQKMTPRALACSLECGEMLKDKEKVTKCFKQLVESR